MIDKDKKKGSILIRSIISPIVSIAVRPNSNTLAISCENGLIY
jgi:cilia- and flagella-associated protein 251